MSRYVSTDWHGNLKAATKVLNDFMKPEDRLYYLGDCADRGPDGIAVFDMLTSDPRVIFIKGNHEAFMEEGIIRWKKYGLTALSGLWASNGGEPTAQAIEKSNDDDNVRRLSILRNMPKQIQIPNNKGQIIILDHCGLTPIPGGDGKFYPYDWRWEPLWDRDHFRDHWLKDEDLENVYVVHGHTPTEFLVYYFKTADIQGEFPKDRYNFQNDPVIYAGGHKIDLDVGTWLTNKVAILDIDLMKIITLEV